MKRILSVILSFLFLFQAMGIETNRIDSEKKLEIIQYANKQAFPQFEINTSANTNSPEDSYIKSLPITAHIPDKINPVSYEDYFKSLCSCALIKKTKVCFTFANKELAHECFNKTNSILDKLNISKYYQQGFLAYAASISPNTANGYTEFWVELAYKNLKEDILGVDDEILIVNNQAEFNTTILNCINNKKIFVILMLNNYKEEKYNLEETIVNSLSPDLLNNGFVPTGKENQSLEAGGIKVVNYIFNYKKLENKINKIGDISNSTDLYTFIKNEFENKSPQLIIRIDDFKSKNINISNLVDKINADLIHDKGYYGYISKLYNDSSSNTGLIELLPIYYDKEKAPYVQSELPVVTSEKELYRLIDKSFSSNLKEITFINNSLINYEELLSTFTTQNFEYPVNSIGYKEDDNKVTINIDYYLSAEQMTRTREKCNEIVSRIITPQMSDRDKIKAIHDYIINNTRYDDKLYLEGKTLNTSYTSYGVLLEKVGVCQGYAAAFNILAKLSGVKSLCVAGKGNDACHAWNMVKLGDEVLYIDTTWDDPVSYYIQNTVYDYYLIDKEKISKDHSWDQNKYSEKYFDFLYE